MLAVVQQIGAAGGLAAVVGLVVLSAVYFSHARDVKRLREWAGRAPEHARQGVSAVPRRSRPWHGRSGVRYVAVTLVGMLVLGGAAANGVSQLTGDGRGRNSGNARANNKPKPGGVAVDPGSVTVAVLNGTTVPGLAATLRDQIAAAGFQRGTINNFPDQQLAESVVEYAPGHQAAARVVSRRLGISRLEPVTVNSRALAGDASVVVVAGADKAP